MSGSLNKVTLIGHLGKDPEIRATQSGGKIASFSLATSERWTDKASGEKRERTEWHQVVIFNDGLVGVVERYLKKGSKIFVEGQMATRKWQDQAGQDRWSTEVMLKQYRGEIILLDRAERAAPGEDDYGTAKPAGGGAASPKPASYAADLDDDIPF